MTLTAVLALGLTGCDTAAPPEVPADEPVLSTSVDSVRPGSETVTVVAAGDIARNPEDGQGTAELIATLRPDAVLPLGDSAYNSGSLDEYKANYDPTWGAFKDITRPIPGNHDYLTDDAAGYFDYFRGQVHDLPYYAWNAGTWRMYALNCDIDCGRDSEQLTWLQQDLAENAGTPALAYVHEPFNTCSTRHPPLRRLGDIWDALQDGGGQLLVSSHNHAYERFARLDSAGSPSPDGLRQFVVGTGGVRLYPLVTPCADREAQTDQTTGVLSLELRADSYSWEFIGVSGEVLDAGEERVS